MRWLFGKDEPEPLPFTDKDFTDIGKDFSDMRKYNPQAIDEKTLKNQAYTKYIRTIGGTIHKKSAINQLYNRYGKFMTPDEIERADQAIAKNGFDIAGADGYIDADILKNAKETRGAYYKKVNGLKDTDKRAEETIQEKQKFLEEGEGSKYKKSLDDYEKEFANYDEQIQKAPNKKSKGKNSGKSKQELEQEKANWIKDTKEANSVAGTRKELLAMHDEAIKAAKAEFNSRLEGLNSEARRTKVAELNNQAINDRNLDPASKGAKSAYWDQLVDKHIGQQLEKAGVSNTSEAKQYMKVATTEREIEKAQKARQRIDAKMRNLNTEEGVREFVSQYRKEQGLLKGGGAEQTSKFSKLFKAGKFAAGVAVATGLLALSSVGTARMMMAGGAQPNSNLYNPYQASY